MQDHKAPEWVDSLIATLATEPLDQASLLTVEQVVQTVRHHRSVAGEVMDTGQAAHLTLQALLGKCRTLSFIASRLPVVTLVDGRRALLQDEERDAALQSLTTDLDDMDRWLRKASRLYVHRAGMAACFCLTEGWESREALTTQ